ncbi:MAG: Glu-tRNA(Gln) amidotransferase subunit GatD, partial [Candidatus Methanomethylicaceae archaeon]
MSFGYKGKSLELLNKYGINIGDKIIIKTDKASFSGILMPRSEIGDDKHIVIKLEDGYNIGLSIDSINFIEKIPQEIPSKSIQIMTKFMPNLPNIAIISTGGTIASRVDYRTGAVSPALTAQDLYQSIPELGDIANINTEILFSILSENILPNYWTEMAKTIKKYIDKDMDGIVLTHGTDTMGYTAAALSFSLRNLPIPVILVGSQRSSDRPSSDAYLNLKTAVLVAAKAPFAEVGVLMHSNISDDELIVHRGTKVRKMHTSRRDAFQSINSIPLAKIRNGNIEVYKPYKNRGGNLELKAEFENKVALIKCFPGMPSEIFDFLIEKKYRGIVLEGTGLGHAPEYVFSKIKRAIDNGIVIVMTSQCLFGRVNMNVYSTGRILLSMGVIPGEDMLPETALVKLMWVLAQTNDFNEIKELMLSNIAGEISERSEYRGKL